MTSATLAGDLAQLVGTAQPEQLPAIAAACASAQALALARIVATSAPAAKPVEAEHWITPVQAARLAGLDTATPEALRRSTRRIYEWAIDKRWARRPSVRKLQVEEGRFKAWLATR